MGLTISSLLNKFFGPTPARLCMLGLDAAGKTTVLYKLKLNEVITTIPTIGFNVEEIQFQNLTMTVWDIGGQKTIRPLWKHYLKDNDGLIFVVDSSDRERFAEVKEELWSLLREDELRNTNLLVFANKQDMPGAVNPSELTDKLDLMSLKDRRWFVQASCAKSGEGIVEGLQWLSEAIKKQQKNKYTY